MSSTSKRKGFISVFVIPFSLLIVSMMLSGMLSAVHQRNLIKQAGNRFSNYYSYESICDISVESFIRDFTSISVIQNTSVRWLNRGSVASYTSAMGEAVGSITDAQGNWIVNDVTAMINGVGIQSPAMLMDLLAVVKKGDFSISIKPPSNYYSNVEDADNLIMSQDNVQIPLESFQIDVTLNAKGDVIVHSYMISNICLKVSKVGSDSIRYSISKLDNSGVNIIEKVK